MGFVIKREDGKYLRTNGGHGVFDWTDDHNQVQKYGSLAEALPQKDACKRAGHKVEVRDLDQPKKMGHGDWRAQAFLILDRKLSESPHLRTALNADGDFEIRCSKCKKVETYPPAGDRKVDAFTFAMRIAEQHVHKAGDVI